MQKNYFPPNGRQAFQWLARWMGIAVGWAWAATVVAIIVGPGSHPAFALVWVLFGCSCVSIGIAVYYLVRYLILYGRQE